jgi:GSH-dependent disulfide-bond oxidoreductase
MVEGLLIMLDLYYWPTPNAHKVTIMLEEIGAPYTLKIVNIQQGDQFDPAFLKIAPNNRMPAIVDHAPLDGGAPISIFESAAILEYLADKSGQFLPKEPRGRYNVLQWLYWQMGGVGPMFGQAFHFINYAQEKIEYAINRYTKEAERLMGVLDDELAVKPFVAGDYSIADMAIYPWALAAERIGLDMATVPHASRWIADMKARPAVVRAYQKAKEVPPPAPPTDETRKRLFQQGRVRKG